MKTKHASVFGMIVFWLSWPLLHVILRIGSRTRVLIIAENDVLLVKDIIGPGTWSLPGGGLHLGELPVGGAIREVKEETGIMLDEAQLDNKGTFKGTNSEKHTYRYHLFVVHLKSKPPTKLQRRELSELRWMPLAQAATDSSVGKVAREIIVAWS